MQAIRVEGVTKNFGEIRAVNDLTLSIEKGTVTVLLGPNGAGKTTTIRLITGALQPDYGRVFVHDTSVATDGTAVRQICGVVPPKPAMYDRLTGRENLEFAAKIYNVDTNRIDASAARFGIKHALDQSVGGYSTGMRTRLALSRAFLHDPEILLLDEPTAGLDPESARAVLALIMELAGSGKTIVLSTHLLHEAEGVADQVAMMAKGQARIVGSPTELANKLLGKPRIVIEAASAQDLDPLTTITGVEIEARNGRGRATIRITALDMLPDVVTTLVTNGARIQRIEPLGSSLEDVYFEAQRFVHTETTDDAGDG